MILSLHGMERMLKQAGAERVGEDAKEALREALEEYGVQLAKRAIALAEHADRKTIKASDIKLAKQ